MNAGVFALVDDARAKRVAFALSGSKTLTTANGAADEARSSYLDVTSGTGGTITIPSVEWSYDVRNASSGDVILTTGAGVTATISAGSICRVVCDGANVRLARDLALATREYVDATAFEQVELPGQTGNGGKFLTTDGVTASWGYPTVAAISDYAADQTTRHNATLATAAAASTALAIAFAAAL